MTAMTATPAAAREGHDLALSRSLSAPPGEVWRAWTDPEQLARWFHPDDVALVDCHYDPRPGGTYRSVLRDADTGKTYVACGTYLEVEPEHRLVFTHAWEQADGTLSPKTRVTVSLSPSDGGTALEFRQVGLSTAEVRDSHLDGWGQCLGNLALHLSASEGMDDRTLVLTRLIRAPRAVVWAAWTDPERLPLWWGPRGFTCRTHEIDLREGGVWRFDMIAPDGTVFPNRHRFDRIEPKGAIDYRLDDDGRGAHHFDAFVRFREAEGGTEVTLTMVLPDAAARAEVEAFGAVEFGYTTLDCLAESALPGLLSVTRILAAPPEQVRQAMRSGHGPGEAIDIDLLAHGPGTRVVIEQTGVSAAEHGACLAQWTAFLDALEPQDVRVTDGGDSRA